MKNLFVLVGSLLFLASGSLFAQGLNTENKKRGGKELRKKHYNQSLQLTEAEAEVFWPIFQKHEERITALKKENGKPRLDLMSDAEVDNFIDKFFDKEMELLKLKKQLFNDLKGKLPARKIAMLPNVEKSFRRELLNRYKRSRGGEGGNNRLQKNR